MIDVLGQQWLMGYPTVALKDKTRVGSLQYRQRQRPIVDRQLRSKLVSLRIGDLRLRFSRVCKRTSIEGGISPEVEGVSRR